MGVGIVRVDLNRLVILRVGTGGITGLQQRVRQSDMNLRIAWGDCQRRAEFHGRFAEFPVEHKGVGEVYMRLGAVGVRAGFAAIIGNGLGDLPARFLQRGDVGVNSREIRTQAQDLPVLFQRVVHFLLGGIGASQIVMRLGGSRAKRESFAVSGNGLVPFLQTSRRVAQFYEV